tara:strand:+ start:2457 stop:2699 length:243 start_codon:yes stop_codon:yes gene_type:complete
MTNDDVKELFEKYIQLENEIKSLREDQKEVLADFKDRVEPKVFRAALSAARAKARLKPHEATQLDQVVELLEDELCVDHI